VWNPTVWVGEVTTRKSRVNQALKVGHVDRILGQPVVAFRRVAEIISKRAPKLCVRRHFQVLSGLKDIVRVIERVRVFSTVRRPTSRASRSPSERHARIEFLQ